MTMPIAPWQLHKGLRFFQIEVEGGSHWDLRGQSLIAAVCNHIFADDEAKAKGVSGVPYCEISYTKGLGAVDSE